MAPNGQIEHQKRPINNMVNANNGCQMSQTKAVANTLPSTNFWSLPLVNPE
ncbi:MAG TPA: hypothetical protein VMW53_03080 [archaeon]|nr:hypothetical protein [archaeon]